MATSETSGVSDLFAALRSGTAPVEFRANDLAFDLQREVIDAVLSGVRRVALPVPRRAGKTDLLALLLLAVAADRPEVQAYYISTTKLRAAATMWLRLCTLARQGGLSAAKENAALHRLLLPNGSQIVVTGVESRRMANDLRGRQRVALYALDEAQDWDDELLRYLRDDVITPSLADVSGSVVVAGTGGSPHGLWYEMATAATWRRWTWTPADNPHLAPGEVDALIAAAASERDLGLSDPSIRREFFAEFVADPRRQVLSVTADNLYDELPPGQYSYAIGVDVGTVDATAVVVWGWRHGVPGELWEVYSHEERGLPADRQAAFIGRVLERYQRSLVAMCVDPGGGGAGLIRQLQARAPNLPIVAAEKGDKAGACVILRSDVAGGIVRVRRSSTQLIRALAAPEWDTDAMKIRGHCPDLFDAALYGHRHAIAYIERAPPPPKTPEERATDALNARLAARRDGSGFGADFLD